MVLELRIPGEDAVQLVVLVHGLGVLHILVEVEGVFLVHFRGKRGVGFLGTFPWRALVVQVAGIAAFFKAEVLPSIGQCLTPGGLLRFLVGRARLALCAPILGARSMTRFAAHARHELVGIVHGIAAFLAPAVHMAAHTGLVLGVIFLGVELGFLLGLGLGVGLE